MSSSSLKSVSVAGTSLDRYFHICAFFDSREVEYSVLPSYYKEGIDNGEKALHIVDPRLREDHRSRLGAMGVNVAGCESCGQLEVQTTTDTYLAGGSFETARMLATIEDSLTEARKSGFPRTRIMGNMSWALDGTDSAVTQRLMEYEARVNDVLSLARQPAICVYDASKVNGKLMLDILRTHPLTLVNGTVRANPFFTPPAEFLVELKKRSENTAEHERS